MLRNTPIQRKLMTMILLISGSVLFLTCSAYFAYEFISFRQTTVQELSTLGEIIAANSTAALAFNIPDDAKEIISAVKANPHIVAAALYDSDGKVFTYYPNELSIGDLPGEPGEEGYRFDDSFLIGYEPVAQGNQRLGTLFLKSDMEALSERLFLFSMIALGVILFSSLMAYLLSRRLQKQISAPILALAATAKNVSDQQDYAMRAQKFGDDELGFLTDSFNHMLARIEEQNLELSAFNQRLEQKVAERTEELEAANKELEAFSYSVSHDLRAPLRSVHGYMNIFSEEYAGKLDDEGRRLIGIIIRNGQIMGKLIDDLLAFSQLGRRDLTCSNVSMEAMVKEIVEEQRRNEPSREITVHIRDLPDAYADSVTIRQVWTNLIGNSFKYTSKKKSATIEIGYQERGSDIVYFIRDNGAGFNMEYYSKLFGVFQRLHSVREFDGTGVGLAIVHRIVQKHGGSIWAEGKQDEGATFFFSLGKNPQPKNNSPHVFTGKDASHDSQDSQQKA